MKYIILFWGLLLAVAFPLCAQEWTPQDSLRLHRLLDGEGEVKLNPDVLKEIGVDFPSGSQEMEMNKSWLDFDASLPVMPRMPEKKVVLTLRPYTANTKYNWDPVYQKKITVNKNTWRGNPFHELIARTDYTNWTRREGYAKPSGHDFMDVFTRNFWDVKGRRRRVRTLEVLKAYGDSITVRRKAAIIR